jgi:1,4-dihydroxy-2-naphthoate octaprenyltransferase
MVWCLTLAVAGAALSPCPLPVGGVFVAGVEAYSYDGIRLKKRPLLGTLVVIIFQGAFTPLMTQVGVRGHASLLEPTNCCWHWSASLFLFGSYPARE